MPVCVYYYSKLTYTALHGSICRTDEQMAPQSSHSPISCICLRAGLPIVHCWQNIIISLLFCTVAEIQHYIASILARVFCVVECEMLKAIPCRAINHVLKKSCNVSSTWQPCSPDDDDASGHRHWPTSVVGVIIDFVRRVRVVISTTCVVSASDCVYVVLLVILRVHAKRKPIYAPGARRRKTHCCPPRTPRSVVARLRACFVIVWVCVCVRVYWGMWVCASTITRQQSKRRTLGNNI